MCREELLRRGYCCGMGCKACPYWPKHQYASTTLAAQESKFDEVFNLTLKEVEKKED